MNFDRAAQMDFSTYLMISEYALMLPYPEEESRIDSLIRPFETKVNGSLEIKRNNFIFFEFEIGVADLFYIGSCCHSHD